MIDGAASAAAMRTQTIDQNRKPPHTHAQAAMHGGIEAEAQLIEALIAAVDGIAQADQNGLRRQTSIALSCMHQMEVARTLHTGSECRDAVFNVPLRIGHQLGSRRWSGRAQVSDKVRNSEVSLVTDSGYDRKFGGCDCAGKPFVVETGEVL